MQRRILVVTTPEEEEWLKSFYKWMRKDLLEGAQIEDLLEAGQLEDPFAIRQYLSLKLDNIFLILVLVGDHEHRDEWIDSVTELAIERSIHLACLRIPQTERERELQLENFKEIAFNPNAIVKEIKKAGSGSLGM